MVSGAAFHHDMGAGSPQHFFISSETGCLSCPDHAQPGLQIVVIGDAGNFAVALFEECADPQVISLAAGRRKAVIGGEIFSTDEKLGGGAIGNVAGEHHEFFHRFLITAIHALEECPEGILSFFRGALVNLVNDIVSEQGQQCFAVAGIEGSVIILDE